MNPDSGSPPPRPDQFPNRNPNPDRNRNPDPHPVLNPDPETLLRALRFRPLPESWRAEILNAAAAASAPASAAAEAAPAPAAATAALPAPATGEPATPAPCPCPRPARPWFRRPLVQGLAAAWALIGALRLTTPVTPALTPAQLLAMPGPPGTPAGSRSPLAGFQFASADALPPDPDFNHAQP